MHTLVQKPKRAQQATSGKSMISAWSDSRQSREVRSILRLQRTIGNQAVLRLLQPNIEDSEASSASNESTGFTHDFSRIPLHGKLGSNAQPFSPELMTSASSVKSSLVNVEKPALAFGQVATSSAQPPKPNQSQTRMSVQKQTHSRQPQIVTATLLHAADPRTADNGRRYIGVGELISFTSTHTGTWNVPGHNYTGQHRTVTARWQSPGRRTVSLQTRRGTTSVDITVVEPRVSVQKIREIPIETMRARFPGHLRGVGVFMKLQFRLTPLNVSFAGLEFREHNTGVVNANGYYARHTGITLPHRAARQPTTVNSDNRLVNPDYAGFSFDPDRSPWPITSGGYQWHIPQSYRVPGQSWQRLSHHMLEAFQMLPNPPRIDRPPFHGRMIVWKGGNRAERRY
jgi:hypothetical protein